MNIQTAAFKFGTKKPKKDMIQRIIEDMYEAETNDARKKDLALMYKYFTPALSTKVKTAEDWVYKARSNDDFRPHINLPYSNGKHLIATDGHRLHRIKTNLPEGFYDNNSVKIDNDTSFPDVSRLFKDESFATKKETIRISDLPITKSTAGKNIFEYEIDGKFFNKRYVDDVANGEDILTVYHFDELDPILLVTRLGDALVMPLKKK